MPRTIETQVYKYSELSDEAKQKAHERHTQHEQYAWADEALDSIKALAVHFNGTLSDYNIDWLECGRSSLTFNMPDDMTQKEIGARLKALGTYNRKTGKGHGECKLTGYCHDESAIDGFRIAWHPGERDLAKLMRQAGESWLQACREDFEYQLSEESFAENCDANGYEFTEDGKMV